MIDFTFTEVALAHANRGGFPVEEMLGTIPDMLTLDDPAGAVDQIDRAYRPVGGGWRDSTGHILDVEAGLLRYPGDPARQLVAQAKLRDEVILFFNGAWIVVVHPDGSFRTARID